MTTSSRGYLHYRPRGYHHYRPWRMAYFNARLLAEQTGRRQQVRQVIYGTWNSGGAPPCWWTVTEVGT